MAYAVIPFVIFTMFLIVLLAVILGKRGGFGRSDAWQQGERMRRVSRSGNGLVGYQDIYQDTQTGVQYLVIRTGYSAAVTPLLNADGTPCAERFGGRDSRFD